MSMNLRRAGFIGLGRMGEPMARRIMEGGYPLTVWARRREALAPFAHEGADIAESVAALGAACNYVGLCVLDDAAVAQAVAGGQRVLDVLRHRVVGRFR